MAKFFKIPFGRDGDKATVPETTQPSGEVSYQQGYGFDYERPSGDPARKLIERDQANQIYFDITQALGEIQQYGAALWTADGAPWPQRAQVYHSGNRWVAIVATSQEPGQPGSTQWAMAPSQADTVPIGAAYLYFGALGDIPANYSICDGTNGTPDLRDRFIVGASTGKPRGTTGGSVNTSSSGSHSHVINVTGTALTVDQIPSHTHQVNQALESIAGGSLHPPGRIVSSGGSHAGQSQATGGGQTHTHGATSASGGSHTHTSTPPYYAAVWIMRIS